MVHGPINLLNILDFYRDVKNADPESVPKSISYRAMAPLYVDEKYRIVLGKENESSEDGRAKWKAEIGDSYGKTGVKATIVE